MCTVTLIRQPGGHRLISSRDESRNRAKATPPKSVSLEKHQAIYPTDPDHQGTWIAVNQAGLSMTLLNGNPPLPTNPDDPTIAPSRPRGKRSRGLLIPSLIDLTNVDSVEQALCPIDPTFYAPFRLVAADTNQLLDARYDGQAFDVAKFDLRDRPWMFTSSGLGDHIVEGPRRELFNNWFSESPDDWPQQQDTFHAHHWPEHGELSICMSRPDAMTVSLTCVQVEAQTVRMRYYDAPPCKSGQWHEVSELR